MALGPNLKFSPTRRGSLMPEPGSTEQALLILLAIEIGLLIVIRKRLGTAIRAHGG